MNRKRILIILVILVLLSAIVNFIFSSAAKRRAVTTETETPATPTPQFTSSVPLGTIDPNELTKPGSYLQTKKEGELSVNEYTSENPLLQDKIVTKQNEAVMKITTLVTTSGTYPPIAGYFTNFGEPEQLYFDAQYGTQVYAWPSKGFAVSGSRELNEAFRTYEYAVMSPSEFENTFSELIHSPTSQKENLGY